MALCLSEEKGRSIIAKAGDTIESPISGARIVFLKTARDTNGELLQLDDVMKGGGRVPIEHVHPYMEERFEILSGSARLSMRGQERDVGAGETVVVHAGTPHVWGNPNEDEVHLILEFRPALRMETWFETFFGLQKDGKINPKSGCPTPCSGPSYPASTRMRFTSPRPLCWCRGFASGYSPPSASCSGTRLATLPTAARRSL